LDLKFEFKITMNLTTLHITHHTVVTSFASSTIQSRKYLQQSRLKILKILKTLMIVRIYELAMKPARRYVCQVSFILDIR